MCKRREERGGSSSPASEVLTHSRELSQRPTLDLTGSASCKQRLLAFQAVTAGSQSQAKAVTAIAHERSRVKRYGNRKARELCRELAKRSSGRQGAGCCRAAEFSRRRGEGRAPPRLQHNTTQYNTDKHYYKQHF